MQLSTDMVEVVPVAQFGSISRQPIFLDQLDCRGTETDLLDCRRYTDIGLHMCDHTKDVGLRCEGTLCVFMNTVINFVMNVKCRYNVSMRL